MPEESKPKYPSLSEAIKAGAKLSPQIHGAFVGTPADTNLNATGGVLPNKQVFVAKDGWAPKPKSPFTLAGPSKIVKVQEKALLYHGFRLHAESLVGSVSLFQTGVGTGMSVTAGKVHPQSFADTNLYTSGGQLSNKPMFHIQRAYIKTNVPKNAYIETWATACYATFRSPFSEIPLGPLNWLLTSWVPFEFLLKDGALFRVDVVCPTKEPAEPLRWWLSDPLVKRELIVWFVLEGRMISPL